MELIVARFRSDFTYPTHQLLPRVSIAVTRFCLWTAE